jgi:predicted porin
MRKLMAGALAAAAALQAHAQAPAEGIQVRLSGQINRALLHADDGDNSEWFNVDNSNSSTRFRFSADGPVVPNWRGGLLMEFEFDSNPSSEVNFQTRSVSPELQERHLDLFLAGPWGTFRLGQGDGAANGAAEVDLSGTSLAHYSAAPDVGGAFEYRTGAGAFSGVSIADSISNQDMESRYDRVLYQSPLFNGFMGEVSWGHKQTDIVELALRYGGKIGALGQIAGALGYSKEDGSPDDKIFGGSISWLHPSGWNLTFAHTERDLPGREGEFNYVKVGYKFGRHALSVDYGIGDSQSAPGDEASVYGIGYVWTPLAWAEVFALYKLHTIDRAAGPGLEDISFFMLGSRVKF